MVVLLSGYLASGKDTVGAYLASYGFRRYAFADALKDEVADLYGLDRDDMDTQVGKEKIVPDDRLRSAATLGLGLQEQKHVTVRGLLIAHGQMRRAQDVNYWVSKVAQSIIADEVSRVVITDWRFPNEYHCLKASLAMGYQLWDIITVRINRWARPPLQDESELALDSFSFDKVIDNGVTNGVSNGTSTECKPVPVDRITGLCLLRLAVDDFVWGELPAIRWFIVDVDDVLLDWMHGFKAYLTGLGCKTRGDLPTTWDLAGWITSPNLPAPNVEELVLRFNSSKFFANLKPIDGAKEMLSKAKELGFDIIAVTSCSDAADVAENRVANLRRHFTPYISQVVCLPLGASKASVFNKFKRAIVVDDRDTHLKSANDAGLLPVQFLRPWTSASECASWESVWDHDTLTKLLIAERTRMA